jgi:hypothetical protein
MLTAICVLALLCMLVYFLLYRVRETKGTPLKGPKGYPLIGSLLDLADAETFHLKLTDWSRTHGDIFALNFIGRKLIIFNTAAVIRDALLSKPYDAIFASRPPMFFGIYMMHDNADIIFSPYSETSMKRRKLGHKLLKMYGEGSGRLETVLHQRLQVLIGDLRKSDGEAIDLGDAIERVIHSAIGILVIVLLNLHG